MTAASWRRTPCQEPARRVAGDHLRRRGSPLHWPAEADACEVNPRMLGVLLTGHHVGTTSTQVAIYTAVYQPRIYAVQDSSEEVLISAVRVVVPIWGGVYLGLENCWLGTYTICKSRRDQACRVIGRDRCRRHPTWQSWVRVCGCWPRPPFSRCSGRSRPRYMYYTYMQRQNL